MNALLGASRTPPLVWPSPLGATLGSSLVPLYPGAPVVADRRPDVYALLALVDGIRVGGARVRALASRLLTER